MKNNSIYIIVGFIICFAILKQCKGEPKVITKTKTVTKTVTDTVTKTIISDPKTVYVERTKTIKGKDSIIYKDKPSETTINANQYETKLESNKATADLKITTTGELLDVQGIITYPEKETTVETIKTRDASGLFIYGSTAISGNSFSPELGLMYQFKNKIIIGAGAQYNNFTNNVDGKITLAIKL